MSLAGKSCVVTGGAAGIGAAIARRLTGAGAIRFRARTPLGRFGEPEEIARGSRSWPTTNSPRS
jgi:NAD(P)-dependent dehydrogenase (short-subunit alcohol dehydrogenase family)